MDILLVRHGIAVERGSRGFDDDAKRPLTSAGRDRMFEAARGLERLYTPQVIFTSPLVRAMQTAEILQSTYKLGKTRECVALATGNHQELIAALEEADIGSVALVGHEPSMSELFSTLLTGHAHAVSATFKKGAAALIRSGDDLRAGECWLEWLIQPAALRRIAQGKSGS
jgi:phosphohistidine phosphatase